MTDDTQLAEGWPPGRGYLLNHSAGLPPRDAAAALSEGLFGPWVASDDQVWVHWMKAFDRFRAALGEVINHEAAMICPQPSVTSGLSHVLNAMPADPRRNRLLIAERAFPSLGFVLAIAERRGFELVIIPESANTLDPDVWERYLDERVHCVVFTHVHSNTSECHDTAKLAELARNCGAISVVDVAQSIGVRPVDARRWNADFIVGSCIKWLCGGPGAGFIWVNPERLAACEPTEVGWFSHSNPFEFDIHHFEYAGDALRFWGGTPSVAPALVAAHAMESLLEVGLGHIEDHNRRLLKALCGEVNPQWLVSPIAPAAQGGTVVLQLGERQDRFAESLRGAGLQFDVRKEGIRLSPHFYNDGQDIARVVECLP
ncbi:aminotransferase class V-fold PLP-dependent enzyme [Congregibacter litoralis]|uniref:Selenocysteine lyase n=1 Tax=Congregibacter litoralis KT71 TaxID=314285 RepID=A4ABU6_9GAMM|nr:aminotransferase class V-fold PLP-dependent enzyme [Congregibacter litoralis]EAQ96609.1 Selenocysteine lyase [Congregibacter litoralis KT71]